MDNVALNDVILNAGRRQFWIALWGDPEHSPEEDVQVFDEPNYDHGFAVNPTSMNVGDILFVHRIHVSKIIFVAEALTLPRKPSLTESEKESWRKRWTWSVYTRNLTPTYGLHWPERAERTFS